MELSFPRYLLAKQSIDDRSLNRNVLDKLKLTLQTSLQENPFRVVEIGAGIGTMLMRLLRWKILPKTNIEYTLIDEMPENIAFARQWLSKSARELGYRVEQANDESIRLSDSHSVVHVHLVQMDVFDFARAAGSFGADLLVAHAFLDLLPLPESLAPLFSLLKPDGLAWLTVNFDGVTTLEPVLNPALDELIERLYHESMNSRLSGGDSQTGRHLFAHFKQFGVEIVSAGASDWVVYPVKGLYPDEEAYFLHSILQFFESSLTEHPALDAAAFENWLARRHEQVKQAELIYIAHQMDFLVSVPPQLL